MSSSDDHHESTAMTFDERLFSLAGKNAVVTGRARASAHAWPAPSYWQEPA